MLVYHIRRLMYRFHYFIKCFSCLPAAFFNIFILRIKHIFSLKSADFCPDRAIRGINILYSPFKYISPEYDESAIKSYLRCTRAMRDAYYANAGGIGGQAEFIRAMTDLVEYGSPLALSRVLNQGGNYVSLIG